MLKTLLLILLFNFTYADEIIWADKVISYSSQKGTKEYSALQVLGAPELFPQGGVAGCSWTHKSLSTSEYLHVGFEKSIQVERIFIAENFRPGAISRIYLIEDGGTEHLIYDEASVEIHDRSRMFIHDIERTEYTVNALKVIFQTIAFDGNIYIDAIGISSSPKSKMPSSFLIDSSLSNIELVNIGPAINSEYNEMLPRISPDGEKLFFIRTDHPENTPPSDKADIWYSEKNENGAWSKAQKLGPPLNDKYYNYVVSVMPSSNKLILGNRYTKEGSKKGVSYSELNDSTWSYPNPIFINSFEPIGKFTSYYFSNNGKTLLIDAELVKGLGGNDLYVSFLQDDGNWSEPKNLGPMINTRCDDHLPYLASDEKTLYFVSLGYPGYGSGDIYMSRRLDDTWENWTKPVNLGPKVNTSAWEGGLSLSADGKNAYLVSSRNGIGGEDIFRFELPEIIRPQEVIIVKGIVKNKVTSDPIKAKLIYEDIISGEILGEGISDSINGNYEIILPVGKNYSYRAYAENYIGVSEHIDLTKSSSEKMIIKNISMVKKEEGSVILLNNIFFDLGKDLLKEESKLELDHLYELLLNDISLKISIEGHTDNIGNNKDNLDLSKRRSKAVYDYLISKGINVDRISYKGFGEKRPLYSNEDPVGRSMNRRVEFRIISK